MRWRRRDVEPMTDPDNAKTALDRIAIPQDVLDRVNGIAPRSSLIITDEALSSETANGTDFVVLLSGEPSRRNRDPTTRSSDRIRSPTRSPASMALAIRGVRFPPGECVRIFDAIARSLRSGHIAGHGIKLDASRAPKLWPSKLALS